MSYDFWRHLDTLLEQTHIVIDRPKGSIHPRMPDITYPLDYGYLEDTIAGDGEGIDVWMGSLTDSQVLVATIATVDLYNRALELKLIVNCSDAEIQIIMDFYQDNHARIHLIRRDK